MLNTLDTSQIKTWRSITTLIVFVSTNCPILWPFHVPIYIPRTISKAFLDILSALRLIASRRDPFHHDSGSESNVAHPRFVRLHLPINFITAPLIAVLFLLAISAIGRQEVRDGTIGDSSTGISPYDVILVFLCLGYIANSIEASGLVRYLVFHVLRWTGSVGHRLFLYLYACFFGLGIFIGNDPIMLSFLFNMTRVSINIVHPRAWIHTQFAIANIATGILVFSNPTNLVLAGAFNIKFINYTANMIVPIFATALLLFPFLLYIVFPDESLIPLSIKVHEISEEGKTKMPVDPKIPSARGTDQEDHDDGSVKLLDLESILNPFLDKRSAFFGAIVMVSTLIILLSLNAVYLQSGGHPDYWVTLPAAFVIFSWDLAMGWLYRHERREIYRRGREEVERVRAYQAWEAAQVHALKQNEAEEEKSAQKISPDSDEENDTPSVRQTRSIAAQVKSQSDAGSGKDNITAHYDLTPTVDSTSTSSPFPKHQQDPTALVQVPDKVDIGTGVMSNQPHPALQTQPAVGVMRVLTNRGFNDRISTGTPHQQIPTRTTLLSLLKDAYRWSEITFPTTTTALRHLPYSLVPFAFSMFVLVEALVNKGWVPVFAHGWDHWAAKTGTVGSIVGMGFLAVILSNFAGTNIGASILLSRIIQAWQEMHSNNGVPISDRTFWATVYSMALGLNFGAFSITFSASLAGIMWRTVLHEQPNFKVRRFEFARINLPIIAFAMAIGCTVLLGEVYIVRDNTPYTL